MPAPPQALAGRAWPPSDARLSESHTTKPECRPFPRQHLMTCHVSHSQRHSCKPCPIHGHAATTKQPSGSLRQSGRSVRGVQSIGTAADRDRVDKEVDGPAFRSRSATRAGPRPSRDIHSAWRIPPKQNPRFTGAPCQDLVPAAGRPSPPRSRLSGAGRAVPDQADTVTCGRLPRRASRRTPCGRRLRA